MLRHRRLSASEMCVHVVFPDVLLLAFCFCCYTTVISSVDPSSSSGSTVKTALSCFRQALPPSLVPASWAASVPDCSTNGTTPWTGVVCTSSASATIAVGGCGSSSSPVQPTWAADGLGAAPTSCDLSPIAHLSVCGASVEWNDINFTASTVIFTNCTSVILRRSTFLSLTIVRSESVVVDSLQFQSLVVDTVKIDLRNYTCGKDGATQCHLDIRTSGSAQIVDGNLATSASWCSIVHDAEAEGGLVLTSLSVISISSVLYIAQRRGGPVVLQDISSSGGVVSLSDTFAVFISATAPNATVAVDGITCGKILNGLDATVNATGDIAVGRITGRSGYSGHSIINVDLESPREIRVDRIAVYGAALGSAIFQAILRGASAAYLTTFQGADGVHATAVITLSHTPRFTAFNVICPTFRIASCLACQLVGVRAASLEITQADSVSIYSIPSPQLWPAVITLTNCTSDHLIISRSNGLRSVALSAVKYVTVQECALANTSGGVVHLRPFQSDANFTHQEPDGIFFFAVNAIEVLEFTCNSPASRLFVIDGVHKLTTLRISHNGQQSLSVCFVDASMLLNLVVTPMTFTHLALHGEECSVSSILRLDGALNSLLWVSGYAPQLSQISFAHEASACYSQKGAPTTVRTINVTSFPALSSVELLSVVESALFANLSTLRALNFHGVNGSSISRYPQACSSDLLTSLLSPTNPLLFTAAASGVNIACGCPTLATLQVGAYNGNGIAAATYMSTVTAFHWVDDGSLEQLTLIGFPALRVFSMQRTTAIRSIRLSTTPLLELLISNKLNCTLERDGVAIVMGSSKLRSVVLERCFLLTLVMLDTVATLTSLSHNVSGVANVSMAPSWTRNNLPAEFCTAPSLRSLVNGLLVGKRQPLLPIGAVYLGSVSNVSAVDLSYNNISTLYVVSSRVAQALNGARLVGPNTFVCDAIDSLIIGNNLNLTLLHVEGIGTLRRLSIARSSVLFVAASGFLIPDAAIFSLSADAAPTAASLMDVATSSTPIAGRDGAIVMGATILENLDCSGISNLQLLTVCNTARLQYITYSSVINLTLVNLPSLRSALSGGPPQLQTVVIVNVSRDVIRQQGYGFATEISFAGARRVCYDYNYVQARCTNGQTCEVHNRDRSFVCVKGEANCSYGNSRDWCDNSGGDDDAIVCSTGSCCCLVWYTSQSTTVPTGVDQVGFDHSRSGSISSSVSSSNTAVAWFVTPSKTASLTFTTQSKFVERRSHITYTAPFSSHAMSRRAATVRATTNVTNSSTVCAELLCEFSAAATDLPLLLRFEVNMAGDDWGSTETDSDCHPTAVLPIVTRLRLASGDQPSVKQLFMVVRTEDVGRNHSVADNTGELLLSASIRFPAACFASCLPWDGMWAVRLTVASSVHAASPLDRFEPLPAAKLGMFGATAVTSVLLATPALGAASSRALIALPRCVAPLAHRRYQTTINVVQISALSQTSSVLVQTVVLLLFVHILQAVLSTVASPDHTSYLFRAAERCTLPSILLGESLVMYSAASIRGPRGVDMAVGWVGLGLAVGIACLVGYRLLHNRQFSQFAHRTYVKEDSFVVRYVLGQESATLYSPSDFQLLSRYCRYALLFEKYNERSAWYFATEMAIMLAEGIAAGVLFADTSMAVCKFLSWSVSGVYVVVAALTAVLGPNLYRLQNVAQPIVMVSFAVLRAPTSSAGLQSVMGAAVQYTLLAVAALNFGVEAWKLSQDDVVMKVSTSGEDIALYDVFDDSTDTDDDGNETTGGTSVEETGTD